MLMIEPNEMVVLLAQDSGPNLGGSGGGGNGTTSAPAGQPAGGTAPASPFGGEFFIIIIGLFMVMIIWSIMGQRKEKKKREEMLGSIQKHDEVQTVGGIIGSVVDLNKDTVVLKVDESSNTRMKFARSAIQQVLSGRDRPDKDAASSEDEE